MSGYSRKQANVIYAAIKRGDLNASKGFIAEMYDNAGEYADACNPGLCRFIKEIKRIVDSIFEGDFEYAQECIDGIFA